MLFKSWLRLIRSTMFPVNFSTNIPGAFNKTGVSVYPVRNIVSFTNNRTTFIEYVKRTAFIPLINIFGGPSWFGSYCFRSVHNVLDEFHTVMHLPHNYSWGMWKLAGARNKFCASVHGSVYSKFDPSAESKNTISSGGAVCTNKSSVVKTSTIQYDNRKTVVSSALSIYNLSLNGKW